MGGEGREGEGKEKGRVWNCHAVECSLIIQTHACSVLLYLIVNTCYIIGSEIKRIKTLVIMVLQGIHLCNE